MIRLFQVTKRYEAGRAALDDVSLHLAKGEFAFLTGRSGAGKSTLIRLLLCSETVTSGELFVFGHNVSRIKPSRVPFVRRHLGVVFQDFKLLPARTVAENVAFPLEVRGIPPREVRRRVLAMLRSLGLEDKEAKLPPALSGGEQQRVAIARALVTDPAILLADEPTGNLDPERTVEVMDLVHAANARGTTVLVATHDRSLLDRYRKRVIALDEGRIASDVDPSRRATGA